MTPKQLQDNIEHLIYEGISCIIKDDPNAEVVHQVCIKTKSSPSLPVITLLSKEEVAAFHS